MSSYTITARTTSGRIIQRIFNAPSRQDACRQMRNLLTSLGQSQAKILGARA